VILGILAVGALYLGARKIVEGVENTFGPARAEDYELNSSDMSCDLEGSSSMTVSGTLTNKTSHRQNYSVSIDFLEGTNGPKLGNATGLTGSLAAGQTGRFEGNDFATRQPRALTCKVTGVSYAGP
jgi:hypothetical protein